MVRKHPRKELLSRGVCISRYPTLCLAPDPSPNLYLPACPPICIYRPWLPICIYRPWLPICVYQSWPPLCFCQPWSPNCLTPLTQTLHLPALVPKLYLPTLASATPPNQYLPVQVKMLLLLAQPLVLSLPLPPPLLQLLLLPLPPLLIITSDTFAAAKSALNDP